jgi:hypothetical protein
MYIVYKNISEDAVLFRIPVGNDTVCVCVTYMLSLLWCSNTKSVPLSVILCPTYSHDIIQCSGMSVSL